MFINFRTTQVIFFAQTVNLKIKAIVIIATVFIHDTYFEIISDKNYSLTLIIEKRIFYNLWTHIESTCITVQGRSIFCWKSSQSVGATGTPTFEIVVF
jgi:hypothetical protein